MAPLGKQSGAKDPKKGHPWRDNIEAITVSIVIIVLFKYFVLEAYKIPTGSMQPTLMGWQEQGGKRGIFDRVLVDKLSLHYRDPERFEIVVFRYPLDRSKNFIKRLWGLPGEEVEIRDGDVFVRPQGATEFTIPRRPRPVLDTMLKRLDTAGEWATRSKTWRIDGGDVVATGEGTAQFPSTKTTVIDRYEDGYPEGLRGLVGKGRNDASHDVGDLRFVAELTANEDCTSVSVVFGEGPRRYTVQIPGPAAPEGARPSVRAQDSTDAMSASSAEAGEALRLKAGRSYELMAQNIDDRVTLELDGDVLVELDVLPISARDLRATGVTLATEGGGARFDGPEVYRDIYYTSNLAKKTHWEIPERSYIVLGDNTQDSSDSRDWTLARYELERGPDAGTVVQGNLRNGRLPEERNPRHTTGGPEGPMVFMHDDLGERWAFPAAHARQLTPEQQPYVHRDQIRGRAVLVVWPMSPSLEVYRLKWVR